jgi:hypothetical protein
MRTKIFLGLLGVIALSVAGCVGTASGGKTGAVPFMKDKVEALYQRPSDEVFTAAKAVIKEMGVLTNEGILHEETNHIKHAEGRINERKVWVRVEAASAGTTALTVQARTVAGAGDIELAAQVDKNIALKLVH